MDATKGRHPLYAFVCEFLTPIHLPPRLFVVWSILLYRPPCNALPFSLPIGNPIDHFMYALLFPHLLLVKTVGMCVMEGGPLIGNPVYVLLHIPSIGRLNDVMWNSTSKFRARNIRGTNSSGFLDRMNHRDANVSTRIFVQQGIDVQQGIHPLIILTLRSCQITLIYDVDPPP